MSDATKPLPLPDGFDPATNMVARNVDGRTYHTIIPIVRLVPALVANGTPQDLEQAEKTIRAILEFQERQVDDPHYGNFRWEREDDTVEDLNAVQFVLFNLIPMMIRHRKRLSPLLQQEILESIRLGLAEIKRLDVHPAYTNIALKDICNACLGGELLNDTATASRGYNKLVAWMKLTDQNGVPIEFNSPAYATIAIDVLNTLAQLVEHPATRIRATVMRNRLALSSLMHIHLGTRRLAGPFSRAYRPTVFAETPPEINEVQDWLSQGSLPEWMGDVLTHRPDTMQITETADAQNGVGMTTYHSPSFALGVASQELTTQANRFIALQSNVCIAHYTVPGQDQAGVFFSRYILNDKWVGDFRTTPSRESDQLLPEEGRFLGVQDGPRAIGLYAPRDLGAWSQCTSAKTALVWLHREWVDEIWIGQKRINTLPVEVPPGETVVVGSGQVFIAVRPLSITDLGRNAPLRLTTIDGHLVLEMHNYLGPAKTFWELAQPGSFYQGQPQCGFYVEVAERSDYDDGTTFGKVVANGETTDVAQPSVTYNPGQERLWQVQYERDGQRLGIEIDLMEWQLKRRWNHNGDLGWPMLESPIARQTRNGRVSVGEATLTCGKEAAWLLAIPEQQKWIAVYHGLEPAPLRLILPGGSVEIESMGTGTVVWDKGLVSIETTQLQGHPHIVGGRLA